METPKVLHFPLDEPNCGGGYWSRYLRSERAGLTRTRRII